ncbi:integral membrane protein DUF92-domain-containing protein [Xylaria intraflava]|nr:integral membrane protein DUF92-domain-containing protein [Xylaria intraflava]
MKAIIAVPATLGLVYRAHSHKSLTPFGILVAALTAIVHAAHPWNLPFVLLIVFFLAGTRATAVKKEVKASLTLSAKGSSGGEGPRTHVQVLANSLVASVLSLLHTYQLSQRRESILNGGSPEGTSCYSWKGDLLVVGIIANYAAVCADTFSSELGILSRTEPRLITSLTLRKVPRGTNGGVTLWGLVAGLLGSLIIVVTSMIFLPTCDNHTSGKAGGGQPWSLAEKLVFAGSMTVLGALGSLLDSFLGGWLQRSVRDVRTGKIVEGDGGVRVLTSDNNQEISKPTGPKAKLVGGEGENAIEDTSAIDESATVDNRYDPKNKHRKSSFGDNRPTRVVETGSDLLDNNEVNFLMALSMSIIGMTVASWYWGVPADSIFRA